MSLGEPAMTCGKQAGTCETAELLETKDILDTCREALAHRWPLLLCSVPADGAAATHCSSMLLRWKQRWVSRNTWTQ